MTDELPTHPVEATLDRSDDRWVLRMERTLNHPAERVWAALTHADEVRRWAPYAPDRDLDVVGEVPLPQAEGGGPAEGPPEPGEVLVADAPRLLVLNWGGHLLRFEITPLPNGVQLLLTHTFDVRDEAADYASGWHLCLNALTARLDGKDVEPVAGSAARNHGWEGLRDEYASMLTGSTAN
jgi:uncharacterized protein YndB with AHSA1/START domain